MPRAAPELLHLVANPLTEPRDRKSPEAPPRRFSPPRPPEIGLAAPLSSDLPRARFDAYWNRCELLILLPFSVFSLVCRSRRAFLTRQRRRQSSPAMTLR